MLGVGKRDVVEVVDGLVMIDEVRLLMSKESSRRAGGALIFIGFQKLKNCLRPFIDYIEICSSCTKTRDRVHVYYEQTLVSLKQGYVPKHRHDTL